MSLNANESPFDFIDFEQKTTQKLSKYYVAGQKALDQLSESYTPITIRPIWDAVQRAWDANSAGNFPTIFPDRPLTSQNVQAFYTKCDNICFKESESDLDLIRISFAANNAAQFIVSVLLDGHPLKFQISRRASEDATTALAPPHAAEVVDINASVGASLLPGDCLRFRDPDNSNTIRAFRIKDHGTSALRGEFFVVTTILDPEDDNNSEDCDIPLDIMEEWAAHAVHP